MGNAANQARQTANKFTDPQAWEKYDKELKSWEQTCEAMDQWETDALKRMESPGCCCLFIYWWQMLGSLCELPFRTAHHLCCFCSTTPCAELSGDDSIWTLHSGAHAGLYYIYTWLLHVLCHNLTSPCEPYYAYADDVSLERPVKPQPPVGQDTSNDQGSKKASQKNQHICCFCCPACSDCWNKGPDHTNRLFRSAFCCLSCHHSCHPAPICGPLCTDSGMCMCCEGWTQRIERWEHEAGEAKEKRTNEFYNKTGRTRIASTSPEAGIMGKPQQMNMV
eukprot:gnl/TRDRNA2_/TRDRNA2_142998_c0_seq1.p1 gnl/TRDRNA2_/TRDRNA2_142998_c0~~gnl/TRDRNA2_/TRDRNA2_142998_c0_seq1.p1  ORF type:complete len:278 (-),score=12.70 gnl/TRDRNA2_/TRDRNA2_142998_c0_seq1:332-1165(-)